MNAITRHWQIVRAALDVEKARGRPLFDSDETAFLPAALEIVQTPVSPTARTTAWVLMGGLVLLILWLFLGKLDVLASAPGRLIPGGNVKLVQSATAGVVRAIRVEEGEHVRAGQTLVELDPTISSADAEEAMKALETAQLAVARDEAVLRALDGHGFRFVAPPGTAPEVATTYDAVARSRLAQIEASSAQREADRRTAIAAREEARAQLAKLDKTIPLLDQEVAAYETLLPKGYVPKLKVIEMRRTRLGAASDRDTAVETAHKADAQIVAAASTGMQDRAQARAVLLDGIARNGAEARARRQELIKSRQRSGQHSLVSPVDGTVTQLSIHTIGGVIAAGKPVMVIVPSTGGLMVEAKVLNRDVGFVHAGQPVSLKLDAYPFTRYGTVPGTVRTISPDAVSDPKLGLVYTARIALSRTTIDGEGAKQPLMPGMSVIADIRTGRRSIASYLAEPLMTRVSEAGHEH